MSIEGAQIIQLKGNQESLDVRLDRLEHFDERSRDFPVTATISETKPRSYTWGIDVVLDQGREGACVGFAVAHELAAKPLVCGEKTDAFALRLYKRAQQLDPWQGEDYEGTSVLAGVKAAQELGFIKAYRWAFGVDDLALAVSRKGPAILGIPWFESMYGTQHVVDGRHRVFIEGAKVGGHAILCRGYSATRNEFLLHNSWGPDWGNKGAAWITYADMDKLLGMGGEACIPTRR